MSSEHDIEGCASPRYTLIHNASLNTVQKEEVDEKVKSIHEDNPIFVAVMRRFNVTGTCTLVSVEFLLLKEHSSRTAHQAY